MKIPEVISLCVRLVTIGENTVAVSKYEDIVPSNLLNDYQNEGGFLESRFLRFRVPNLSVGQLTIPIPFASSVRRWKGPDKDRRSSKPQGNS